DLFGGAAVTNSPAYVDFQLVRTVQRGQQAEVVEAALLVAETFASPDTSPAVLGHHLLEVTVEVGDVGRGAVDILVAQHLAPDRHALVVEVVCHVSLHYLDCLSAMRTVAAASAPRQSCSRMTAEPNTFQTNGINSSA